MVGGSMKNLAFLLAALAVFACLPAGAQGTSYNYSYGSSRVVNQNQTGLYHPSGTYIGPGTMSQSARGLPPGGPGSMSNPLLPRVNMGANVRTPGDNLYQPGSLQYQQRQNTGLPPANMGANIGTPGDGMRSDLRYYQQGQQRFYPQPYQQQSSGILYKPGSGGGVATYAEHTFNNQSGDGARRF